MPQPALPIEVLSHIAALIPDAYHPTPDSASTSPTPPRHVLDALDPYPAHQHTAPNTISALSKSSHELLEASRPWLWEDVDVRSGRGWLAVVNALTEEVGDQPALTVSTDAQIEGLPMKRALADLPMHTQTFQFPVTPISPENEAESLPATDAHVMMNDGMNSGYGYFHATAPSQGEYPTAYASGSTTNALGAAGLGFPMDNGPRTPTLNSYSPPQPSHAALLLTPPGSRGTSPRPGLMRHDTIRADSPAGATDSSGSDHALSRHNTITASTPLPSSLSTARAAAMARLRGRSRSPRRSVGFDTEGISSVLDRSRSASAHIHSPGQGGERSASSGPAWPRRIPLDRRRSSLSRARTWSETGYDEDDEEDDIVTPLSPSKLQAALTPPKPNMEEIDDFDDLQSNCNPELLPPPGPYIRHLSFNNFRTIGSRRTQDEAVRGRFVTAGRLEGVIKNCPNLISLCMTEYVDSSLSFPVLEDLLFRGYRKPRGARRPSISQALTRARSLSVDPNPALSPMTVTSQLDPPRPEYVPYEDENEEEKWTRRGKFTALQALDLTGCVSHVFTNAMREFCLDYLDPEHDENDEDDHRGRSRHRASDVPSSTEEDDDSIYSYNPRAVKPRSKRTPRFSAMRRLSLRACTTLDPPLLHDLVLAFPNLTHLDLSNTRIPTSLIVALTESPHRNMRLQSLSLARCPRLDPTALVNLLVLSTATRDLTELNLYMNPTQGNAITTSDLDRLLTAPCIKSGRLRYLDLSSAGLTAFHLQPGVFPAQPRLISLGLSHIPTLPLQPIADFLLNQAPNVEILTIAGTAFDSSLSGRKSSIQTTLELHAYLLNPLTTIPFSLASLSLNPTTGGPDLRPGATHLRVVELSAPIRKLIADGGSGEWKVVKSKGGRGWYVDLSAGWVDDLAGELAVDGTHAKKFVRHLPGTHPRRMWLSSLAYAGGRVRSAVGWHSRKMEVVRGMGMLGREEGMAGVGGFAFDD